MRGGRPRFLPALLLSRFLQRTSGVGATNNKNGFRNLRTVWSIPTQPYRGAHFAPLPPALVEPCIKAASRPGDAVLDPFSGSCTSGLVAGALGRHAVLCELNSAYAELSANVWSTARGCTPRSRCCRKLTCESLPDVLPHPWANRPQGWGRKSALEAGIISKSGTTAQRNTWDMT